MLPLKPIIFIPILITYIFAWKIPNFFKPGPDTDGQYIVYANKAGELLYDRLKTNDFWN